MLACGLDFGTSNSMVALATADGVTDLRLEPDAGPDAVMPTLLFCTPDGDWSFGTAAKRAYVEAAAEGRFIQSVKRYLPSRTFGHTWLGGRRMDLPQIVATFLAQLRRKLVEQAGGEVDAVLMGRPAVFHDDPELDALAERRLGEAARLAGFRDVAFRREPIAAARAFEGTLDREVLCLVGDLGGGTSDFTVMRLGPDRVGRPDRAADVLGSAGVNLAGNDIDAAIVKLAVLPRLGWGSHYKPLQRWIALPTWLHLTTLSWHQLSFAGTPENLAKLEEWGRTAEDPEGLERLHALLKWNLGFELFQSVEACKRTLSSTDEAPLRFSSMGVELDVTLTRDRFERAIAPVTAGMGACLDGLLDRLALSRDDIDVVFLTGGTSLVPAVRRLFDDRFGGRLLPGDAFASVGHGLGVEARERFGAPRSVASSVA
jgi:hypothetical chaperone protein